MSDAVETISGIIAFCISVNTSGGQYVSNICQVMCDLSTLDVEWIHMLPSWCFHHDDISVVVQYEGASVWDKTEQCKTSTSKNRCIVSCSLSIQHWDFFAALLCIRAHDSTLTCPGTKISSFQEVTHCPEIQSSATIRRHKPFCPGAKKVNVKMLPSLQYFASWYIAPVTGWFCSN